jgi:hypothetical protein
MFSPKTVHQMTEVQAPLVPRMPSSPIYPKSICMQIPNSLFFMSSFQIEVQNSAGAKAQVESRYPGAYNITLIQLPSSSSAVTAACEFLHAAVCAPPSKDAKRSRYGLHRLLHWRPCPPHGTKLPLGFRSGMAKNALGRLCSATESPSLSIFSS